MPPEAPRRPTRALSGIQPTGRFHWGNYFGAIRQYIDLQPGAHQAADEAYYFIADLHALTTVRDPARLRSLVHAAAVDLVALLRVLCGRPRQPRNLLARAWREHRQRGHAPRARRLRRRRLRHRAAQGGRSLGARPTEPK